MFRLLKLAAVALFGYAVFEFLRGLTHDTRVQAMAKDAFNRMSSKAQQAGGRFAEVAGENGSNMTGPGEGVEQATLDTDGGSVRHKVGRGVVH